MRIKYLCKHTYYICGIIVFIGGLLMSSCIQDLIPEEEPSVSVKDGNFNFVLSFAPYGEEAIDPTTRSSASESIVIPVDDDLFIYATLSTDPVEKTPPVSTRAFNNNSKVLIVAYEEVAQDTYNEVFGALYRVDGNNLLRDGGSEQFYLPQGSYKFIAYSYNTTAEPTNLSNIDPINDLIRGESQTVLLDDETMNFVPITMYHKLSQIKAVATTGQGGDPITTVSSVTLPGYTANLDPETGVVTNHTAINQVITFSTLGADTVRAVTRTVFTGNPAPNPTVIHINTLVAGTKTLTDIYATFAKPLLSGYSYTLLMRIGYYPVITDDLPPAGFIPYVGAFWKSSQTGERLIRIPRVVSGEADGVWTAQVIAGKDWIILDKVMTSDPNVGWLPGANESLVDNGNDNGFDGTHAVTVTTTPTFVSGYLRANGTPGYQQRDDEIYFRIGLSTQHSPPPATPRYGMVLLTYANNNKRQRIWIRQGEEAAYVMKPDGSRPNAMPFSPYNLKDPLENNASSYDALVPLGFRGGVFVDYPSQAGYFFHWNRSTVAIHPTSYPSGFPDWPFNMSFGQEFWSHATDETCPMNYRRPQDGDPASHNPDGFVAGSELRQSLWLNPFSSNGDLHYVGNIDNAVWGYYADGFFDRRLISNATPGTGYEQGVNSGVSVNDHNVANVGRLFYNPDSYASLFFPASGYREASTGPLYCQGTTGYFQTSSSIDATYAWQLWTYFANGSSVFGIVRAYASSVRCVKDETPELIVNPTLLRFPYQSGNQTVSVYTNQPSWTAVSSEPWATVSPASGIGNGNFTITCANNGSNSVRTATITVTAGSETKYVSVIQDYRVIYTAPEK